MTTSSASGSSRRSVTTRRTRTAVTIRNIRLTEILKPEDVIHHAPAESGEEVLSQLLHHLALDYGIGNFRAALAEVMRNIRSDPSNALLRKGVLVPYARLEKVDEPLLAVATSDTAFTFEDLPGHKFHVVVAALVPSDMPGAYKQILQGLEHVFPENASAAELGRLPSALAVWQHFDAGDHHLPDHLQARHLMDNLRCHLRTNDTLKEAIDCFVKFNTPEVPVLNADHEIVGVVTLKRLVRTFMPDYLMWVGDMSEFLNFEPIAEVVRNEAYTWIRDIMTLDFARVDEEAPAIFAMKEIGQRETLNAYVLRGRKLVGIIRMLDFVKTVLR